MGERHTASLGIWFPAMTRSLTQGPSHAEAGFQAPWIPPTSPVSFSCHGVPMRLAGSAGQFSPRLDKGALGQVPRPVPHLVSDLTPQISFLRSNPASCRKQPVAVLKRTRKDRGGSALPRRNGCCRVCLPRKRQESSGKAARWVYGSERSLLQCWRVPVVKLLPLLSEIKGVRSASLLPALIPAGLSSRTGHPPLCV